MGTVKNPKKLEPTKQNPFLGLTKKQEKFVLEYIKTKDATKAIEAAFNPKSHRNATVMGYDYINRPHIRKSIEYAMMMGVNREIAYLKLQDGLNATKHTRTTVGLEEVPDLTERRNYLDMYFKLTGEYAPEKREVKEKTREMTSEEVQEEIEELKEYEKKDE